MNRYTKVVGRPAGPAGLEFMNRRLRVTVVSLSTVLVAMLLMGAVMGRSAGPDDPYPHLSVYAEVLSRIKSEYVEEPDIKNVTLGAVNGMLEAIDPFASYLNPDQYKQYTRMQEARKAGVGLLISKKFGYVGVVDVIPGTSAARAGLATGDMIEAINGIATRDMPLAYAEILLQGEPGSNVEMSVLRVRKPEPTKITLTRAVVRHPSVTSKLMSDGIGLVQVPVLDQARVKETAAAVEQLQKQGAKRLILDLRNNGSGRPEEGVALANLFLEKGMITWLEGQRTERKNYEAEPGRQITKLPIALLTNRGTAAGAEVAAAALLDNKRAEVIGERTYGDAAVRKAITMDDGSAVILSVAKFYAPSGKAIQDTGVTPGIMVTDFEVPDTEEDDSAAAPPAPRKEADDPILKRAVEFFTKGTQAASAAQPSGTAKQEPAYDVAPKNPLLTR